jgi:hypothetical protein
LSISVTILSTTSLISTFSAGIKGLRT